MTASPDSQRPLAGRASLVTGASSGLGAAIAEALAAAGAELLLTGRSAARLAGVAGRCRGATPHIEVADLEEEDEVRGLAAHAGEAMGGRLDILVHSAGIVHWGPVATTPIGELDRLMRVNLRAPYLLTQLLLPLLRAARGQVVFLNSQVVRTPRAGTSAYAASKAALLAVADSLRTEVAEDGVRVLSVLPGRAATPMQRELRRLEGLPYEPAGLLRPDEVAALVVQALMPQTAEVTELVVRPRP